MNARQASEDLCEDYYDQKIQEADMLGNALMAGFVGDKIAENKKRVALMLNISSDYSSYKTELDKLE